jgi:methionyl-tRNA formyltransferase
VRVVFFGTPEFAVPALRALVGEGFDVVAVVTQPDKPQGRSRSRLISPPVKVAAEAEELPVLQPEKPTDAAFVARLRDLEPRPDVGVVVAYGHILRPELLALPARGMVNVHPSLLPELRGAAPVEWAIIRGLEKTGVTIMQMDSGMDSGPILHQIPHHLDHDVTGGELSDHLAEMGALALIETLALIEQDALRPAPQDHSRATYAPKLTRASARIDWTQDAAAIARLVRGLDPRPGAWTELDGAELKLFGAHAADGRGPAGELLTTDGRLLIAAGSGGAVAVEEVQPVGKERMPAGEWLRGARLAPGRRVV